MIIRCYYDEQTRFWHCYCKFYEKVYNLDTIEDRRAANSLECIENAIYDKIDELRCGTENKINLDSGETRNGS